MKILLASPLRQKPHILKEHFESVKALELPQDVSLDSFYIVNDAYDCIGLLKEYGCGYNVINTGDEYRVTNRTHIWTRANLTKMSSLRNACINEALFGGYDAILFCDTDIVLNPKTICALLNADKDICAEIFWTQDGLGEYWANAWHYDQSTTMPEEAAKWHEAGTYKVGGTGACMLVRKNVLECGVNYSPIPCIKDALIGEDRYFAIRAQVNGFGLWLDTHAPCTHLYTETVYKSFMEGKNARTR